MSNAKFYTNTRQTRSLTQCNTKLLNREHMVKICWCCWTRYSCLSPLLKVKCQCFCLPKKVAAHISTTSWLTLENKKYLLENWCQTIREHFYNICNVCMSLNLEEWDVYILDHWMCDDWYVEQHRSKVNLTNYVGTQLYLHYIMLGWETSQKWCWDTITFTFTLHYIMLGDIYWETITDLAPFPFSISSQSCYVGRTITSYF